MGIHGDTAVPPSRFPDGAHNGLMTWLGAVRTSFDFPTMAPRLCMESPLPGLLSSVHAPTAHPSPPHQVGNRPCGMLELWQQTQQFQNWTFGPTVQVWKAVALLPRHPLRDDPYFCEGSGTYGKHVAWGWLFGITVAKVVVASTGVAVVRDRQLIISHASLVTTTRPSPWTSCRGHWAT